MLSKHPVPELSIFSEALYQLERQLIHQCKQVNAWFQGEWQKSLPPVYGSVDLRNAGFKLAPIDMNLFPAGFNNLNQDYLSVSVEAVKNIISGFVPNAKKILLLPESHTRNIKYWSNVQSLKAIIEKAGFEVHLASLSKEVVAETEIQLSDGQIILIQPLVRTNNRLHVSNFNPDLILLNNDLADGIPEILLDVEQPILPPPQLGWSHRLKSEYFQYYTNVAHEFARDFSFDPWLIDPLFRECGKIDFMQQSGMECVIKNAAELFDQIKRKYAEYNIQEQPFLIIKANSGTYGMAVMTVRNVAELDHLNRKQRTKMSTTKGGQAVTSVIIQEGIYTFETHGDDKAVAEPVVYLFGDQVVGGFYRIHQNRAVDENLNAPGMRFEPLAFTASCNSPNATMEPTACQNRFYIYGVIAKLGMLAAAREMKERPQK